MENEHFSLCWNNFHQNLRSGFHSLLQEEDLVDVTLAAEGKFLKAHKTVLSICSPYFKELFKANPCKHPIVILQDVKYSSLCHLLQFMYKGEVSVSQHEIPVFMKVAEMLQVKGLTEGNTTTSNDKNGLDNDNASTHSTENSSERQQETPSNGSKSFKKLLRPIEHLRALSPESSRSSPSPYKRRRTSERLQELSKYASVKPKQEPLDKELENDNNDECRDSLTNDRNLDMSLLLDTTLNESAHSSSSWNAVEKWKEETSSSSDKQWNSDTSPGTLQCILGRRGNPRLLVDGHVFYKKSTYKGKSFWYCKHGRTPYKCPAVCWTLNGDIVKWPCAHTHEVIPETFNPDEDVEVPIDRLHEVLLQSALSPDGKYVL